MTSAAPAARPRFRTDLVAEPIDDDGQRYIDVIDPDTGNTFRFYEVEYSIACAMDGERDLSGLAAWAKEELGIAPSTDELATVISTLGELGYLEAADSAAAASSFADELLARGVVVPVAAPEIIERAPDVELGAGGLTAGWNVPATAAFAAQQAPAEVEDVELGHAVLASAPAATNLESMDIDLGVAGRTDITGDLPPASAAPYEAKATLRPSTKPDSDDDGPTNLPRPATTDFDDDEVSVDLSEHLAIRPQDVKEAVRASQVMKAVDVPPELLAQLDEREAEITAAAEAAKQAAHAAQAPVPTKTPVAIDIPPAPVDLPPPVIAKAEPVKMPVELPREPVAVGKSKAKLDTVPAKVEPKAATPPPRQGTSGVLIAILVLVIIAGAAFAVWKFVIDKPSTTNQPGSAGPADPGSAGTGSAGTGSAGTGSAGTGSAGTGSAGTGSAGTGSAGTGSAGVGSAAAAAAPTVVTLHSAAGTTADIKAPSAGVVSLAPAVGATVKAGDVIVRLAAPARIETKVAELDYDITKRVPAEIKRYQDQAAAARTAGNEAAAKGFDAKAEERSKRLAEKQAERAKFDGELAALIVKADADGTVKKTSAKGAQVVAGAVVATLEQAATLTGEFNLDGSTLAAGATVKVASKAAADQQAACTVTAVDGPKVTISCPADSGWADGTAVQLVP